MSGVVTTSHKQIFGLPNDMTMFAYSPHGALVGIEYWWNKDISRFKRSGEDSEERKGKEEIDEGRNDRELHDEYRRKC